MSHLNLTPPESAASILRRLLAQDEIIVCPGVYDGFTARMALNAGFKCLYMTGAGTTMSLLGQPDLGLATLTEMSTHASTLASLSPSVPLIADADTGYGGALSVSRTVSSYISSGVAALHLEDQVVTKRCGHLSNKLLVEDSEFYARIKAASLTREKLGRDIVIIARTDALADRGYDIAVERLRGAVKAGADVVFLEGVRSKEEAVRFNRTFKELGIPSLYNCVPGGKSPVFSVEEAKEVGYKILITPTLALGAVFESVKKAYEGLLGGDTRGNGVGVRTLFEECGLDECVRFDGEAGGGMYEKGV